MFPVRMPGTHTNLVSACLSGISVLRDATVARRNLEATSVRAGLLRGLHSPEARRAQAFQRLPDRSLLRRRSLRHRCA